MKVLNDFPLKKVKKKKHGRKHLHATKLFDADIEDYVKKNKGKKRTKRERIKLRKKLKKKRKQVVNDTIGLTKTGINVQEHQLVASICRDSFYAFVQEFWDILIPQKPVWNWHIEYLCNELQQMAERIFRDEDKKYDLVVNVPPGTTKSTIMSVMFPAWLWTRMPSCRYIGASHAEKLALDLSMKCRDIIKSDKYRLCFPEVILRDDQDTKTKFQNTAGGYRYAIGVDGAVIGMHADVVVLDDPIDVNSATSMALLKKTNYWIDSQLSNRKVSKSVSVMILVMQRLHQDDPTTLFLKRKKIRHICLPAERSEKISPPELVKYYTKLGGRLLDPVRLSHDVLEEEKQKGQYYFASQFAQDPVPAGGGMFKVRRIKFETPPEKFKRLARYWDKAGSTNIGSAFTVGTKMGLDFEGRFWVLDVVRFQKDSFEREKEILRLAHSDGKECRVGVEQEPGSGGKESAEATVRALAGFRVEVHRANAAEGGKIERADPFSVQVNSGNVYIAKWMRDENGVNKGWLDEWIEEHRYFPNSKYKDQVDSSSGAFKMCHKPILRVGGMKRQASFSRKKFFQDMVK